MVDFFVNLPTPYSMRITGMDHNHRNMNHTRIKANAPANLEVVSYISQCMCVAAPPSVALLATILGNRHMFPVPTTAPSMESKTPKEEEKVPCKYHSC